MAGSTLWCDGLAWTATRQLATSELAWLRERERHARYARWVMEAFGIFAVFTAVVLVFITAKHSRDTGSNAFILGFAAIPLGLITASVCVYVARRWRTRAIGIADGLSDGRVLVFRGRPSESKVISRFGSRDEPITAEIFPSGVLFSVGRTPIREWEQLPLIETAGPSTSAGVARLDVLPLSDGSTVTVGERTLSEDELNDLKVLVGRMKLDYLIIIPVLLSVYLGLAGTRFQRSREWWPSPWVVAAAAIAMAGSVAFLLFWIGPRTRIGRDVRDATVVVVISESRNEEAATREIHVHEYLEHSHMPWSEDGIPASWRLDAKIGGRLTPHSS